MNYSFRKATDEEMKEFRGGSKICSVYDYFTYAKELEEKHTLVLGQLKTLFGEPLFISKDFENLYEYMLCAETPDGERIYLSVYCGPTGPAIGGNSHDEKTVVAAKALSEYIISAEAADYELEGFYMDGPCKIVMGVKDGKPYMNEEVDVDDDEFAAVIDF